jgi:hypothetical protein
VPERREVDRPGSSPSSPAYGGGEGGVKATAHAPDDVVSRHRSRRGLSRSRCEVSPYLASGVEAAATNVGITLWLAFKHPYAVLVSYDDETSEVIQTPGRLAARRLALSETGS